MSSSSASGLLGVASALPAIGIIVVGLRFLARRRQQASLKLDDFAVIPALAFVIGLGALSIYSVKEKGYGTSAVAAGNHPSGVGPTLYVFQILQVLALGFIKLAALLFFRRIFWTGEGRTVSGTVSLVLVAIVSAWTIAFLVTMAADCGDHAWAQWSGINNYFKYCRIQYPNALGFAVSDFLLDVIILVLPLIGIWPLHMSIQRKLGVTLIFLTALVGLAASIARLVYITYVEKHGTAESTDTRLEDTELFFWGMLEAGLSLIAVNLPSIWSLISRRPPEKLLRSFRSTISLQSRHLDPEHNDVKHVDKSDETDKEEVSDRDIALTPVASHTGN